MIRNELKQSGKFLVYNKGNNRKKLFYAEEDFLRFIKTALLFQFDQAIPNLHRVINKEKLPSTNLEKSIELLAYSLDAHQFQMILNQSKPELISRYMQRLMTSYTKYYNQRYNHEGALFRGAYKLTHLTPFNFEKTYSDLNLKHSDFSSGYDKNIDNSWNGYLSFG